MFNAVDEPISAQQYFFTLKSEVRKELANLKERAGRGRSVSCSLIHSVIFKAQDIEEKAVLQYTMAELDGNTVKPGQTHTVELMDGGNYHFNYLTSLIKAAASEVNDVIDFMAMNEEFMTTDDITAAVNNFIMGNFQSLNVHTGYSVQTYVVNGGITQITIVVA